MGRIIKTIEIEGRPATALFDSGAMTSYVRSTLVGNAPRTVLDPPARVGFGGRDVEVREYCLVRGKIEGLDFVTDAVPLPEIGRADGHDLDVVIGARTLEQWEIGVHAATGTLDFDGLRRREFTEF